MRLSQQRERGAVLLVLGLVACGDPTGVGSPPLTTAGVDEAKLTPKQLLGKRLFEDTNLSEPAGQACASCHQASQAFTGNNGSAIAAVAVGSRAGSLGTRNAPTVLYASFIPSFAFVAVNDDQGLPQPTPQGGLFWDGRASDLSAQAQGPFLNPREMNNPDATAVITKVRKSFYASLFRDVYGEQSLDDVAAAYTSVGDAIADFEATPIFRPFSSRFDQVLRGAAQFNEQEGRGFDLFKDPQKGNCLSCHVGNTASRNPADWLFTDHTFDNLGVPRNPSIPDNADATFFDLGLCARPDLPMLAPDGFEPASTCGAFKVPSLRNVALTSPYMHNGFFTELRDVVRFYVTRDTNPELWYQSGADGQVMKFNDVPARYVSNVNTSEVPYDRKPGQAPRLDDDEIDAVVAFLLTLTDE